MDQKTIDGNILISKYMDAVIEEWYPKNTQYPDQSGLHASFRSQTDEEKKAGILTYPGNEKYHAVELLKYHSSWEWLMTVVEKIESMGYEVEIGRHLYRNKDYFVCTIHDQGDSVRLEYEWYSSKIKSVYDAIVEFIKWYNRKHKNINECQ